MTLLERVDRYLLEFAFRLLMFCHFRSRLVTLPAEVGCSASFIHVEQTVNVGMNLISAINIYQTAWVEKYTPFVRDLADQNESSSLSFTAKLKLFPKVTAMFFSFVAISFLIQINSLLLFYLNQIIKLQAITIRFIKATTRLDRQRLRSFRAAINTDGNNRLLRYNLVVWIASRPRHTELILGDLLEELQLRIREDGEASAYGWYRHQSLMLIWTRTRGLYAAGSSLVAALSRWWTHHHKR